MITGRRLVRILLFSGGTLGVLLLLLLACGNSVATGQWLTLGGKEPATGDVTKLTADVSEDEVFSPRWKEGFSQGELGCQGPAMSVYVWRMAGWGSNMNLLELAWAHSILNGDGDLAVVLEHDLFFERTVCSNESNGVEAVGWPCIFAPMPHVCVFHNDNDWKQFMAMRNVSQAEIASVLDSVSEVKYFWKLRAPLRKRLDKIGVNFVGAMGTILEYLYSNLQPWFKAEIWGILEEPAIAALRNGKFIGLHIRRGDKLTMAEAKKTDTAVYLEAASTYLQEATEEDSPTVEDIAGIWLSSDDDDALQEVKKLAQHYFPNVDPDKIIWISGRLPMRVDPVYMGHLLTLTKDRMEYHAIVCLIAELHMLAEADVFVGTFSSNLARSIYLMRDAQGHARESTISVDMPNWFPGR